MGCQCWASCRESDFVLFEFNNVIFLGFEVYFVGWDCWFNVLDVGVMFYYLSGDIKKVFVYDQVQIYFSSINWQVGVILFNYYFNVDFSVGIFELGFLGSGLFDGIGKIRGQLYGGFNGCDDINVFYGCFMFLWDEGSIFNICLMDWLDFVGINFDIFGGFDVLFFVMVSIGGIVINEDGILVVNIIVYFLGLVNDIVIIGVDGLYIFFDVLIGSVVGLYVFKDDDIQEGIFNFDFICIGQYNLGLFSFDSFYKEIVVDVNNFQFIFVLD